MMAELKQSLVYLLLALCAVVAAAGMLALSTTPYTGIRMEPYGTRGRVASVDRASPAAGQVRAGDIIQEIDGVAVPTLSLMPSPDYLDSWTKREQFWSGLSWLDGRIHIDQPVTFKIVRHGVRRSVLITPSRFPIGRLLARLLPIYAVAWSFLLMAVLVLRKKRNGAVAAGVLAGTLLCLSHSLLAPYTVRDLTFPISAFHHLTNLGDIMGLGLGFASLHLAVVFPRRRYMLTRWPWLIPAVYGTCALIVLLHTSRRIPDPRATSLLPLSLCIIGFVAIMLDGFIREKNLILRKQTQWVVVGFVFGTLLWLFLTLIPMLFGGPLLSEEISLLPTVAIPISFAFAITRYRLMEIDTIFDQTVVYGVTLVIFEAFEVGLLYLIFRVSSEWTAIIPLATLPMVLLAIFAYVPLRSFIRRVIERIFHRGEYSIQQAVQSFLLGLDPTVSPMHELVAAVERLLGPSGLCILERAAGARAIIRLVKGERAQSAAEQLRGAGEKLWEHLQARPHRSRHGYELGDAGALDEVPAKAELETTLFVPFGFGGLALLVVLLEKRNGRAYSKKDQALMETLSIDLAPVFEAHELRRAKSELEAELGRQREHVVRELHDGLGGILTSVAAASHVADHAMARDLDKARSMVRTIADLSEEGVAFMRTGLMLLDSESGALGSSLLTLRRRIGELLPTCGVEMRFVIPDELLALQLGAGTNLNIIRCVQESVNNILKHARAKHVDVSFAHRQDCIMVDIRDDGVGFAVDQVSGEGRGMRNIRMRAQERGGSAHWESAPGQGTHLHLSFPLPVVHAEPFRSAGMTTA